jgi:hypothetical protein
MSRIEALPADQKSVLQLLLRQGKGYEDLSALLRMDAGEVRSRAHDALDALGPGAGGVSSARRQEIADWLLGQQGPDEAAATRAFLDGSPAAKAWAGAVASELEPLAGGRLPAIPADGAPAQPTAHGVPAERAVGAAPAAQAVNGAPAQPPGATPFAPAPTGAPRVSRRGGIALIAGAVAVAAAAVVLFLVLGGDDNAGKKSASTSPAASTAQDQPRVTAQVNLTPPQDAPEKKAVAIVQVVDVKGQQAINAVSQGLPTPKNAAYGIWVYSSPSQARLIGGFNKTDNKGHLVFQGALPQDFDISAYNEILVTRETSGNPKRPGTVYLRGTISGGSSSG